MNNLISLKPYAIGRCIEYKFKHMAHIGSFGHIDLYLNLPDTKAENHQQRKADCQQETSLHRDLRHSNCGHV